MPIFGPVDIRNYIKDLLCLHDCLIIPEFGGFVTGYQSSEIHKFRNLVYPPSKSLMFNRRLQANDGTLINYVAQHEKIAYREAEEKVRQFAIWWNRLIENKGVLVFPEVGKLYVNSNNVLVFLPELRKNYLLDTFGMKPIAFHPQLEVISIKERNEKISEPMDEAEYTERLRIKRKRKVQLMAAAAMFAALLFMLPQLFFQNLLPEKIRIEQLSLMNIFDNGRETVTLPNPVNKENVKTDSQADQEKIKEDSVVKKINADYTEEINSQSLDTSSASLTPVAVSKITNEPAETGNYYIVFGSYEYISDAIRMKKQLDVQLEKTFSVFSTDDGGYRVGLFSGTKENAEASLPEFESSELKPQIMLRNSSL